MTDPLRDLRDEFMDAIRSADPVRAIGLRDALAMLESYLPTHEIHIRTSFPDIEIGPQTGKETSTR